MDAKEKQAAEANKNATILLQEIDLEKVGGHYLEICLQIGYLLIYCISVVRNMKKIAKQLQLGREPRRKGRKRRNSKL